MLIHASEQQIANRAQKRAYRDLCKKYLEIDMKLGYIPIDKSNWREADIYLTACRQAKRPVCFVNLKSNYSVVRAEWKTAYAFEGFSKENLEDIQQLLKENAKYVIEPEKRKLGPHYVMFKVLRNTEALFAPVINAMFVCPKEYRKR